VRDIERAPLVIPERRCLDRALSEIKEFALPGRIGLLERLGNLSLITFDADYPHASCSGHST
jgi:hypothetical protein